MTAVSNEFDLVIRATVGENFETAIAVPERDEIMLKGRKHNDDKFYLKCANLTEDEILKVCKIVSEVYDDFCKIRSRGSLLNKGIEGVRLNSSTVESREFVLAVLDMKCSALHKLLLLTSGNHFLTKANSQLVTHLAQIKRETCSDVNSLENSVRQQRSYISDLYLLPGVSDQTNLITTGSNNDAILNGDSDELYLKLLAFIANNSDTVILEDFLKLDLESVIRVEKDSIYLGTLSEIKKMIESENYRKLALSMTASDLIGLSCILSRSTDVVIPENILRSRSKSMINGPRFQDINEILAYLTVEERRAINSNSISEDLDLFTSAYHKLGGVFPSLIYAALAEVLVVKGEQKTIEILRELDHLKLLRMLTPEIYQATALLVVEALQVESDEWPFGWTAQLSEHAWVLTSHIEDDSKLALKM